MNRGESEYRQTEQGQTDRGESKNGARTSVATVMTNVFQKNGIIVSRKLATIMRIFADIGHIRN